MPHKQFPCKYLYWQKIEDHENIKNDVLPKIYNLNNNNTFENPFELCRFSSTSFSSKHNNFLTGEQIDKIIWTPIDNMIREINEIYDFKINTKRSILKEYWFNIYNKGDFQEFHEHMEDDIYINDKIYNSTFSGIYIINDESCKNKICFMDQLNLNVPYNSPKKTYSFQFENSDYKEGSVLIFPSSLYHYVKPVENNNRITIAFNVYSTY